LTLSHFSFFNAPLQPSLRRVKLTYAALATIAHDRYRPHHRQALVIENVRRTR